MTLNEDLELFLKKFAHELRNPLTTLYGTIQLIEHRHPEVKTFPYWNNIQYDIEYINVLLDDLTCYSNSGSLHLTSFDLSSFLQALSLSFASSIESSGVKFTAKIDPAISQIIGDKTKLQEVFRNLLKNAYEAALSGQSIEFSAKKQGDTYIFSISDTGNGIPSEHLDTLFQPFVTHKSNGTGIGLAVCKQVVEAHHGTISVSSEIGVGTTFLITLPADQCRCHDAEK